MWNYVRKEYYSHFTSCIGTGNAHSMEKVPSMENFPIYQTEYYIKHEVFGKKFLEKYGKSP